MKKVRFLILTVFAAQLLSSSYAARVAGGNTSNRSARPQANRRLVPNNTSNPTSTPAALAPALAAAAPTLAAAAVAAAPNVAAAAPNVAAAAPNVAAAVGSAT